MTVIDQTALEHMPERIRKAREHLDECRERETAAKIMRNRLVIAAVDGGMSNRTVAAAAGISQPHVIRILSHQDDYDS